MTSGFRGDVTFGPLKVCTTCARTHNHGLGVGVKLKVTGRVLGSSTLNIYPYSQRNCHSIRVKKLPHGRGNFDCEYGFTPT